ncbi:tryptophan 7-halogenase [Halomonas sp. M4R5S39]|uniref:tryptophan 7-halogenase n=1 Tax=Halomonas kalidii TaxID=3043293 RepID=UPI0024A83C60|nr:tryptophan 7-halogenase [Halomonas kalidii]MDI5986450.1 tryptophan 7-halogenase [Halomonas kalidii]
MPASDAACRVAIVGGGPAGCAAALALLQRGLDGVTLIEAGDYGRPRIGESLPPDTRDLLIRLGLWVAFQQQGHDPCLGSCSAWGDDQLGYNDFISSPHGSGWHLDRRRFERWLADEAVGRGADLITKTRLQTLEASANGFRLHLRDNTAQRLLHADYLIDASGGHARVARQLGARLLELDQLICVYGFFTRPAAVTASRLTLLEAVEYGWWYRASLPDDQLCIALACDLPELRRLRANDWQYWLTLLAGTRHTASNLEGHGFHPARMQATPAPSGRLDRVMGARWLAVGDAATRFDPLTARGVHKALEDGLAAADVIIGWQANDPDPAQVYGRQIRERYEEFRQMRRYLYAQERRWPDAAFWQERQRLV